MTLKVRFEFGAYVLLQFLQPLREFMWVGDCDIVFQNSRMDRGLKKIRKAYGDAAAVGWPDAVAEYGVA